MREKIAEFQAALKEMDGTPFTKGVGIMHQCCILHSIDIRASFDLSSYRNRSHQILVGGNAATQLEQIAADHC